MLKVIVGALVAACCCVCLQPTILALIFKFPRAMPVSSQACEEMNQQDLLSAYRNRSCLKKMATPTLVTECAGYRDQENPSWKCHCLIIMKLFLLILAIKSYHQPDLFFFFETYVALAGLLTRYAELPAFLLSVGTKGLWYHAWQSWLPNKTLQRSITFFHLFKEFSVFCKTDHCY